MESKIITEQLTEFNKNVDELKILRIDDMRKKTLLLLCSLPRSFKHFKHNMLYGK